MGRHVGLPDAARRFLAEFLSFLGGQCRRTDDETMELNFRSHRCPLGIALVSLFGLSCAPTALARPAQIILLRHAEKPAEEANPHLSAEGRARARALVSFLTTTPGLITNGLPVALFAAQPTRHGHSLRTHETLEPLAKQLKLRIQSPYPAKDYPALARHLLRHSAYDGKVVVVCWVHEYLPEFAAALGVSPTPAPWRGNVFDHVWVITYRDGEATLTSLPQKLPADS